MPNLQKLNNKILVITYYWFPYSGTGVYRISKFVKYLKRLGWNPIILTTDNASSQFEENIPDEFDDLVVYRTNALDPTTFLFQSNSKKQLNPSTLISQNTSPKKILYNWIRLNLFIPDAKLFWQITAIPKGKKIIRKHKPKIIFSTSPPPTTNLIALKLSKWSKLPWVADFRDPWTNIYYYDYAKPSSWSKKINQALEKKVLQSADSLTVVNNGFFSDDTPPIKEIKITNGFDKEDIVVGSTIEKSNDKFVIRYMGSFKPHQYAENFFCAIQSIENEYNLQLKLSLEFYGYAEYTIKETISKYNIDVIFHPFVVRNEALKLMQSADLLLMIIGKSKLSKIGLSTKIFEYLMAGVPILGLGDEDGDAAKILNETKAGKMFNYSKKHEIEKYLVDTIYAKMENHPLNANRQKIDKYDFATLTLKLNEVLKKYL
ncbi:MAG TPA: hypothetical protein ACFCUD_05555 [Cyclobacteriaceae bacterium]